MVSRRTADTQQRPLYELKVVRERRPEYAPVHAIRTSGDLFEAFKNRFERLDREEFIVVLLDGKNRTMGFNQVSVGTLTASLVHPREVFQPAILSGACAVIVGHNHPSGDPSPSAEDRDITRRLAKAGELLGIRLLDSVVWVRSGPLVSLQESEPKLFTS